MRFKFGGDRRNDWRCCFCCHVRTGTIFLGLWHVLLHIIALSVIAVILRNPEVVFDYVDDSYGGDGDNSVSGQNKMNLAPALPTPLSSEVGPGGVDVAAAVPSLELDINFAGEEERIMIGRIEAMPFTPASGSSKGGGPPHDDDGDPVLRSEGDSSPPDDKRPPPKKYNSFTSGSAFRDFLGTRAISNHDLNAGIVVTFCTFIITLLMVYGAVRSKPSYLMPFFCLQVFDFCIACLTAVGYLCYLPDVRRLVIESRHIPFADQLHDLNPQYLSFLLMLTFAVAMALKAYFIGVVWRCYRYLSLRRVAQLRTVHFIDSPPDAPLGAAVAPDSPVMMSAQQEALLLLPDYETAVNDPRYAKGGEKKQPPPALAFDSLVLMTPPPAYSSVMQDANQVVPEDEEEEGGQAVGVSPPGAAQATSHERAVPASPRSSPPSHEATAAVGSAGNLPAPTAGQDGSST